MLPCPLFPEMTCGFLIQLVFYTKICLCHQSVTSFLSVALPPKKNPGSAPVTFGTTRGLTREGVLRAVQGGGDGLTFVLAENLHYANLDKLKRQDYYLL